MKKIIIIFILFVSSCGYQPIYVNKNTNALEFSQISIIGDVEINRKIINSLNIKKNSSSILKKELILSSSYEINETSKNSKGQVVSYRSTIRVELKISENEKLISDKIFIQDFTYANRDNKFDLVEYQTEVKNNLANEIIEDMILYMNLK